MVIASESVGLTEAEKKVYITLAGLGSSTVNPIVKATGMHKSSVYLCLDRLIAKGLVSHIIKNNKKVFEAEPTEKLIDFFEKRKRKLDKQQTDIQKTIKALMAGKPAEKREVRVFDGFKGMTTAFEDILRTLGKGETYHVMVATADPEIRERFIRFVKKFHSIRHKKKIKVHYLIDNSLFGKLGRYYSKLPLSKVKKMPTDYFIPTGLNIYKNKVMIAVWTKKPLAIIIKSNDVADSFRNYFELIWKIAK